MLMQDFFTVVGILAIGVIAGYLITPFIFYLMKAIAYVLAVIAVLLRATLTLRPTPKDVLNAFPQLLCKFRYYANEPIYGCKTTESNICFPNHIYNTYNTRDVGIVASSQNRACQKPNHSSHYATKQNNLK